MTSGKGSSIPLFKSPAKCLKAIGGARQLASAKSEAEGMLNQQLQKSQRMMERLLMTLSMSRRG